MYTFAESYGKLQVFMTHRHQDLYEYYFKNLNIEESEDEATSRLSIHKIMVKDASNMSVDELISWAEEDAETRTPKKIAVEPVEEDVDIPIVNLVNSPVLKNKLLGRTSPSPSTKRRLLDNHKSPTSYVVNKGRSGDNGTGSSPSPMVNERTDKGKGIMVEDTNTVKKAVDKGKGIMVEDVRPKKLPVRRNNGIVIQENVEPSVMESDSSSESESDPANGINFSLYSGSDSESGWYSDKSVDYLSEGEIELMELRKRKSEAKKAPKNTKKQSQPATEGSSCGVKQKRAYVVGDNETVIEHEEFMDDLLRKLSADNGKTDPFHVVETKVEKYPIHDEETHWRMRKPTVCIFTS